MDLGRSVCVIWQKLNLIFIGMFLLVCNHLKIRVFVFLLSQQVLYIYRESHVEPPFFYSNPEGTNQNTAAGSSKDLYTLMNFMATRRFSCMLGSGGLAEGNFTGVQSATSPLDATKSSTL